MGGGIKRPEKFGVLFSWFGTQRFGFVVSRLAYFGGPTVDQKQVLSWPPRQPSPPVTHPFVGKLRTQYIYALGGPPTQ